MIAGHRAAYRIKPSKTFDPFISLFQYGHRLDFYEMLYNAREKNRLAESSRSNDPEDTREFTWGSWQAPCLKEITADSPIAGPLKSFSYSIAMLNVRT